MEHRYKGTGIRERDGAEFPYLASGRLRDRVNMAITLGRPLLVKGPPGCGKTTLARAIAHELDLDAPLEWHVKSTSRARDGIYTIDAVRRLQDAQRQDPRAKSVVPYIRFGKLGEAIKSDAECVVLIDEIDKADIDFPNDLLQELEESRFTITEVGESDLAGEHENFQREYGRDPRPIVIITSNDERQLPDAFLRRCLFHHIEFPEPDALTSIVAVNAGAAGVEFEDALVQHTIDRLLEVRKVPRLRKPPATSELLDWIHILHAWGVKPTAFEDKAFTELPHWEILLKYQQDIQQVHAENAGA